MAKGRREAPARVMVSVDATGANVFVANYRGGNIAAFRAQADGSLGGGRR